MRKLFGTFLAAAVVIILAGMSMGCDKKEPTPSGGNGGNGGNDGPKTVAVTGVSLSKSTISLTEGGTETLTATVSPDNASNKSVSWKSSATDIATVDGSGKVTAVKPGSATITVSTTDGGKTATCSVTVIKSAYETERAALEAFYKANNGDNWINNTGWCSDAPLREWTGITMTPDGKHVQAIELWNIDVQGYIPEEIANLTELEFLSINNQSYSTDAWPLPEAIGSLEKLKSLQFQCYTLGGTLPESLFNLKNLEVLRIRNAEGMTPAPIPPAIGDLTNLKELDLSIMNLTGDIPSEIGNLTGLTELSMFGNHLTGGIPDSFGNLVNLEELNLQDNQLSGDIPASFYRVRNYWTLWPELVADNNFTQENIRNAKIPAPKSPPITLVSGQTINLEEEFAKNQYTVLFNTSPGSDGWDIVPSLLNLYNANKDKGLGVIMSYDNNYLEKKDIDEYDSAFKEMLRSFNVTWDSFTRHMYDSDPSAIEGKTSPFYTKWGHKMYPLGAADEIVLIGPDQTVQYATIADHSEESRASLQHFFEYISDVLGTPVVRYESTDYDVDGKVTVLQKASVGLGVDLVITGDGYSDRLIEDGTFADAVQQAVEDFFSVEPYKSMRDRFNIYRIDAVSKNEEFFNGCSTTFSSDFVGATALTGDNEKALEYAAKAVEESRMDDVVVLVLVNSGLSGGTAYMMSAETDHYAAGSSVAWVPYKNMTVSGGISRNAQVLIHETGGHGFGKLNDEYSLNYYGGPDEEMIKYIKECHKKNLFVNVDVTGDPNEVLWSRYIGDDRFAQENIGVYKGGASYFDGIWRPTENSVMRTNSLNKNNFFNAPSRAQIYTRIMKLSEGQDWQFDYETFVKWDQAHPTKQSTSPATRANYVEVDEAEYEICGHPVIINKTWSQMIRR